MENLDTASSSDIINYNPSALEGRIGSGESPEDFIRRLKPSQSVPCPWGSFHGKSDEEVNRMFHKWQYKKYYGEEYWKHRNFDFPLALELGCGEGHDRSVRTHPGIGRADITLLSDYIETDSPFGLPENYVQIDLTKPEQIDLGGIRCHWIAETMVLTRDTWDGNPRYGVVWPSRQIMLASLNAIVKLLLPNGLLYIDPAYGFPVDIDQFAQAHNLDAFWIGAYTIIFQKRA